MSDLRAGRPDRASSPRCAHRDRLPQLRHSLQPHRPVHRAVGRDRDLVPRHYEITGKVYLSSEFTRFSDAWESLVAGSRAFIPITDVEVRRQNSDVIARAKFMQVQKSEIRGAVPASEEL